MPWHNYEYFTHRWLDRAERGQNANVDIGDRFISLWIAFNGWMKSIFGEPVKDVTLIRHLKQFQDMSDLPPKKESSYNVPFLKGNPTPRLQA